MKIGNRNSKSGKKLRHERGWLCPGHDSPKIELTGLAEEELGKKGENKRQVPGDGLADGVENSLLETARPAEAGGKSPVEG